MSVLIFGIDYCISNRTENLPEPIPYRGRRLRVLRGVENKSFSSVSSRTKLHKAMTKENFITSRSNRFFFCTNRFTFSVLQAIHSIFTFKIFLKNNMMIRRREQIPDKSFLKSSRRDLKTGATMYVGSENKKRENQKDQRQLRNKLIKRSNPYLWEKRRKSKESQ